MTFTTFPGHNQNILNFDKGKLEFDKAYNHKNDEDFDNIVEGTRASQGTDSLQRNISTPIAK